MKKFIGSVRISFGHERFDSLFFGHDPVNDIDLSTITFIPKYFRYLIMCIAARVFFY